MGVKKDVQNVIQKEYEAWKKRVTPLLPKDIECPECDGEGTGECPYCGSDQGDCETCGGAGVIEFEKVLTYSFYRTVQAYEEALLDVWVHQGTFNSIEGIRRNPLNRLIESAYDRNERKDMVVLRLPLT